MMTEANIIQQASQAKTAFSFGNRCGHDPLNPKLYKRSANKGTPPVSIQRLISNQENIYFKRKAGLQSMEIRRQMKAGYKKNGMRSERREVVHSVVAYLADHYDFVSGTAVKFRGGKLIPVTISDISEGVGAGYKRVDRALSEMRGVYYESHQLAVKERSVKKISKFMFLDNGVSYSQFKKDEKFMLKKRMKVDNDTFDPIQLYLPKKKKSELKRAYNSLEHNSVGSIAEQMLYERGKKKFDRNAVALNEIVGKVLGNQPAKPVSAALPVSKPPVERDKTVYLEMLGRYQSALEAYRARFRQALLHGDMTESELIKKLNDNGFYHPEKPPD